MLERLDDEFGPEVNFHLQHQYHSAPAIKEWANRTFYGKRAPEAAESVQTTHFNDLLMPDANARMVTDPLVLVDLSRLEGEWHADIFEVFE